MLAWPLCVVESFEAAATVAPSVGINDRVTSDLDTLRSVLKILTHGSIPLFTYRK